MRWAWMMIAAGILVLALQAVPADFAAVTGFSGRREADCSSCHTSPPEGVPYPEAEVTIDGLPNAWDPNTTYALTITVSGGPQAAPEPQPQGGFELEVGGGTLHVPAGMEPILRPVGQRGMTYTPQGTLMRSWDVDWTSPDLAMAPASVGVWVAAVSANGNHVIATNVSDGGERGDSVATHHAMIAPSPAAQSAWQAMPLASPTAPEQVSLSSGNAVRFEGRHLDANATHLAWDWGDGWHNRSTSPAWVFHEADLAPGTYTLQVRSEGAGRTSPAVPVQITVEGGILESAKDVPAPLLPLILVFIAWRTRP